MRLVSITADTCNFAGHGCTFTVPVKVVEMAMEQAGFVGFVSFGVPILVNEGNTHPHGSPLAKNAIEVGIGWLLGASKSMNGERDG